MTQPIDFKWLNASGGIRNRPRPPKIMRRIRSSEPPAIEFANQRKTGASAFARRGNKEFHLEILRPREGENCQAEVRLAEGRMRGNREAPFHWDENFLNQNFAL